MIDLLIISIPIIWLSFSCYLFWYVTSTNHNVIITKNYANTLWKIHKGSQICKGLKWTIITHKEGKIIGFNCDCGYTYSQKKPVLSSSPKNIHKNISSNSEIYSRILL